MAVKQKPIIGRPRKFCVQDFIEAEEKFFIWCERKKEIPDVEGLAVYLDTCRETICATENLPEFADVIGRIKSKIAHAKKQLAMQGKIPPAVFCFDFKNNHRYRDQHEQIWEIKKEFTEQEREEEILRLKKMLQKQITKQ